MSIPERVMDAQALWIAGKREGALLMMLVAVAATSRKRYPIGTPSRRYPNDARGMGDREAFETFMGEELQRMYGLVPASTVRFRGQQVPLQEIIYKYLRCELAHEADVPSDIRWIRGRADMLVLDLTDAATLGLPDNFLDVLAGAVAKARENAGMFGE